MGIDKRGLHFDVKGGIHANVDVKNTKTGKNTHIGGDAERKASATVKDGKVTTNKQSNLRVTGLFNIFKGSNNKNDNGKKNTNNNSNKGNKQNTVNKGTKQNNVNKGNKLRFYYQE